MTFTVITHMDMLAVQEYEKKFVRPAMFKEVYSRIQVIIASYFTACDVIQRRISYVQYTEDLM